MLPPAACTALHQPSPCPTCCHKTALQVLLQHSTFPTSNQPSWPCPTHLAAPFCPLKQPCFVRRYGQHTALLNLVQQANTFNLKCCHLTAPCRSSCKLAATHSLQQLNQCLANSHVQFCKHSTTPWQQATFWKVAVAAPLTGLLQYSTAP
jgi:hypothetical protein